MTAMSIFMYTQAIQTDVCRLLRANTNRHIEVCNIYDFIMHIPISVGSSFCLGTYHQYDTVVYPKNITSKSFYERAKEKAKTFFWWSSDSQSQEEENITILSPFEMGKFCLHVYLDGYKQMLCSGSFPQQANIQMIVEEICKIFALLYNPVISYSTPSVQKLDRKFTEVCFFFLYDKSLQALHNVNFSLHLGNEGMAGICCRCITEWSS